MSGPITRMRAIDAAVTAARLDYHSLIDRLDAAFRTRSSDEGADAPLRHRHDLPGGGTMLIKPA